jgi:hypothetical protein
MTATTVSAADSWKETLQKQLPLLGHRNWRGADGPVYHARHWGKPASQAPRNWPTNSPMPGR